MVIDAYRSRAWPPPVRTNALFDQTSALTRFLTLPRDVEDASTARPPITHAVLLDRSSSYASRGVDGRSILVNLGITPPSSFSCRSPWANAPQAPVARNGCPCDNWQLTIR